MSVYGGVFIRIFVDKISVNYFMTTSVGGWVLLCCCNVVLPFYFTNTNLLIYTTVFIELHLVPVIVIKNN